MEITVALIVVVALLWTIGTKIGKVDRWSPYDLMRKGGSSRRDSSDNDDEVK